MILNFAGLLISISDVLGGGLLEKAFWFYALNAFAAAATATFVFQAAARCAARIPRARRLYPAMAFGLPILAGADLDPGQLPAADVRRPGQPGAATAPSCWCCWSRWARQSSSVDRRKRDSSFRTTMTIRSRSAGRRSTSSRATWASSWKA